MDDCVDKHYSNGLIDSSSYIIITNNEPERSIRKGTAEQITSHPLGKKNQTNTMQEIRLEVARPGSARRKSSANQKIINDAHTEIINPPQPYCHVRLDSLFKLKDSTQKLLCLLEDIQSKTHTKPFLDSARVKSEVKPVQIFDGVPLFTDFEAAPAIKTLESKTKSVNTIHLEDEDDDCSIFKRLTRKCNCLNQVEYNDFIIHFNEDPKYCTSTIGEIIKNMRILKKFLYMGGKYTRNALMFLNEGLADSSYTEKTEITQGCSHADMCNVFEDYSIVITYISLPCKFEFYGDAVTQNLAANFINKLAQLEEGRRYLKFTSRVTNDIKQILRKRGLKLDLDTSQSLNETLKLLQPPMTQHFNATYYCRPFDEGSYVDETLNALTEFRNYMTMDEIFTHLELLQNLSNEVGGKKVLTSRLPSLITLCKYMVKEYDNSEMNIIVANILNNILTSNMVNEPQVPKTMVLADVATEPIKMKNQIIQMPPPKKHGSKKARHKSRGHLNATPNKYRQVLQQKDWEAT